MIARYEENNNLSLYLVKKQLCQSIIFFDKLSGYLLTSSICCWKISNKFTVAGSRSSKKKGRGLLEFIRIVSTCRNDFHFSHLFLSNLIVAVRNEVLSNFGESVSNSSMSLCWRGKSSYFYMQIFQKMLIFWISRWPKLLFLKKSQNCVKAAIAFVCTTYKRQLLFALL